MSKAQIKLMDHSEAKVQLFRRYFSIYLNVISRSPIERIYLYDLFCGEGIYEGGGKGSPIVALETIKSHYYSNGNTCPIIFALFNDIGESKIEPGVLKTDRVKRFADKIFKPDTVTVGYRNIDYNEIVPKVAARIDKQEANERALVFIDPWGYKEIDPDDIKALMKSGKAEVILFLPIIFMARFANKSKDLEFAGGKALREFLGKLFTGIDQIPHIHSQKNFIFLVQEQFKKYMNLEYVDTFKIERETNKWFCIFFFTRNKRGFQKMLESKWDIDKKRGDGFVIGDEFKIELFDDLEISGYSRKVAEFLFKHSGATNQDLADFGLKNNFLPKHTKTVLDELAQQHKIELLSLDGKPARSYYLGDEKRKVNIKIS